MKFESFNIPKNLINKEIEEKSSKASPESYVYDYFPASYQEKVLPIIEIIKPDELSLSEYQEQVSKDLFESIKKRQLTKGNLISDPEEMVEEARSILIARLKAVLEDYRIYEYSSKKTPDKELVKKARIALLFLDDDSDIKKYNDSDIKKYFKNKKDEDFIYLRSLALYVTNSYKSHSRLTESDIDSLLKTKYAESLLSTKNSYMNYMGNYGYIESISNSLMIGLVQAEERELGDRTHSYVINDGLKEAEKNKYDNECLEQLLSANYDSACLEYNDKFSGQALKKILESGMSYLTRDANSVIEYRDYDIISSLNDLRLSKENFEKYLDLAVKHTISYDLRNDRGAYNDHNGERQYFLKDTIEKLEQIRLDVDFLNDADNFLTIKEVVNDGYIGLALSMPVCEEYVKKYALHDYDNFLKNISNYNQEHLAYKYLKSEDKIKYAEKLISRGEEYLLVKFSTIFDKHSLGPEIFNKINEKKLATSLRGDLSSFKNLSEKNALEFIERSGIGIFVDNLDSFSFSEEFLYNELVQEVAFSEFEKGVFSSNPKRVRKFYDKIPFPEKRVNDLLIRAIDHELEEKNIIQACQIIQAFPEVRPLLQEQRFYDQVVLNLTTAHQYPSVMADILEAFPLPAEILNDEDFILNISNSLLKQTYTFYGYNERAEEAFRYTRRDYKAIVRINEVMKLPKHFIEFGEVIDQIKSSNFKRGINIRVDLLKILSKSEDPKNDLDKCLTLLEEIDSEKVIEANKDLDIAYISKFLNNDNKEEKKEFFEKIKKDIRSLAQNDEPSFDKDPDYYKYILQQVYPPRNYNTYNNLDKYENLNHHLDKYNFNRDGYDIKLSGLIGYKIKEGFETDQTLLDQFSKRIRDVKNLAKSDNLNSFLEKEIINSKAETIEGKILEYFKEKNYSVDNMNVLLAYQLLGSYDDFASASTDRLSVESDKVFKDYILLDEIANQYGDNMKETIKTIHSKVVNSADKELFTSDNRDQKEKKYQEVFLIIVRDLNKIPKERLNSEIINKKISRTIKNVFQGFPEIQKGSDYFSSLFNINDLEDFEELWEKRIDELFRVDSESSINLSKIESLQSSVFNLIQAEISKYEEIKEVDHDRGEVKLRKDRLIKAYFSKNKENAHARMVADVCIANDPNMLKNENYFELVLFDQDKNKCVGTVMLLEMNEPEDNKKYLLYNPNPSVGLVSEVSAKKLYQLLTQRVSKFAQDNNFDAVLFDKTHGKSTNRSGLFQQSLEQSCLKDGNGKEIEFNLKNQHHLGSFYSYQNNLRAAWIKD